MKRLLLITLLFLITPDAKADMNYVCLIRDGINMNVQIKKGCERNNILHIYDVPPVKLMTLISLYCRQDREINYIQRNNNFDFTCVLYDNKIRKIIPLK